jgi:PD-(D/E)XK endonuclease
VLPYDRRMGDVIPIPGVSLLVQDQLFEPQTQPRAEEATPAAAKRDTKRVGDASEACVLAALVKAGYSVLLPFGENHRYDLVIDDGRRLQRVQVKTGRLRRGVVAYSCSSSHTHRGGVAARPYFGQADVIAVYCPQNGKVYLVPEHEFVATRAHLRLADPQNNQSRRIRWARDFELA